MLILDTAVCVAKPVTMASHLESDDADVKIPVMNDVEERHVASDVVALDVALDSVHQQPLLDTTNTTVIIGQSLSLTLLFIPVPIQFANTHF